MFRIYGLHRIFNLTISKVSKYLYQKVEKLFVHNVNNVFMLQIIHFKMKNSN